MKTFSDLKGDLLLTELRIWCPDHPSLLLRYQNEGLPCYSRIAVFSFKAFIYKVSMLFVLLDALLFHQEVSYENWVVHTCTRFVFHLSANTQVSLWLSRCPSPRMKVWAYLEPTHHSLIGSGSRQSQQSPPCAPQGAGALVEHACNVQGDECPDYSPAVWDRNHMEKSATSILP